MIVLDASVVVASIRETDPRVSEFLDSLAAHGRPHAPELLDLEVTHALRRIVRHGGLSLARAGEALDSLIDSPIERWPHTPLLEGIWRLRDRLAAYDASYLALADILRAPLATLDAGLAAVASDVGVEVIVPG